MNRLTELEIKDRQVKPGNLLYPPKGPALDPITFAKEYPQIPLDGCLTIADIDRLPPGTTFKLNRDYYYSHKALWKCRHILFCPAQETAYKLDPNDLRDRKLIEHYQGLRNHP